MLNEGNIYEAGGGKGGQAFHVSWEAAPQL